MAHQNPQQSPIPTVFPTRRNPQCNFWVGPSVMRRRQAPSHLWVGLLIVAATGGCAKRSTPDSVEDQESAAATNAQSLPDTTFTLRDDTPNLLLTWVDEKGDFLVGEKISDVPEASKGQVRVVITTREEGTGQSIFVADLRSRNADGTYPLKTLTRSEWNEIGASRRKVRMEALAPAIPSSGDASTSAQADTAAAITGVVKAVIYGASWCKPCHDAEKLLKKLGVDVTKKDIEQSQAAQAEMQQKLAKAGRGGASIPVIDVAGQLFVGFEPNQLKQAVERARKSVQ
jgi:glutaredoxin